MSGSPAEIARLAVAPAEYSGRDAAPEAPTPTQVEARGPSSRSQRDAAVPALPLAVVSRFAPSFPLPQQEELLSVNSICAALHAEGGGSPILPRPEDDVQQQVVSLDDVQQQVQQLPSQQHHKSRCLSTFPRQPASLVPRSGGQTAQAAHYGPWPVSQTRWATHRQEKPILLLQQVGQVLRATEPRIGFVDTCPPFGTQATAHIYGTQQQQQQNVPSYPPGFCETHSMQVAEDRSSCASGLDRPAKHGRQRKGWRGLPKDVKARLRNAGVEREMVKVIFEEGEPKTLQQLVKHVEQLSMTASRGTEQLSWQ